MTELIHELLAVRTMATLSREIYGRMVTLERYVPGASHALVADLADQFARVSGLADGQGDFLQGVIEFYQTRTSTMTTIAAEQAASTGVQQNDDMRKITAWVAIVAVPSAVTGFFGQNVPYPGFGTEAGLIASIAIMLAMAVTLYLVFKHKRWL